MNLWVYIVWVSAIVIAHDESLNHSISCRPVDLFYEAIFEISYENKVIYLKPNRI
jgi:hypothetical protein